MSRFPFPDRRRTRLASTFAVVLGAGALVAAPAYAAQAEQISRADGASGASPIESHWSSGLVTEDGQSAYFAFGQDWGTWATASGLWRRDLATNKSSQIVGGKDVYTAGLSTDGKVLGFGTSKRLVAADTNNAYDLYRYDTATRKIDLISRWDGLNAAAAGLPGLGEGYITRDGKTAIYSTSAGVARRDIATGKVVKVADGRVASGSLASASADGKVFGTSDEKLVTPSGVRDLAIVGASNVGANVSPNGRYAVVTAWRSSDGEQVGYVLDTTTGVRTAYDPKGLGAGVRFVGFSTDDKALAAKPTAAGFEVIAIALPGGATSTIAKHGARLDSLGTLTANGKFATATVGGTSFVTSADGTNIPGGVDLPSPGAYLTLWPGCRATGWPFYTPAQASWIQAKNPNPIVPVAQFAQLDLRVTSATGAVLHSGTYAPSQNWSNSKLPIGGGYRIAATVRYADGRSVSESWLAPYPNENCPGFQF